jgi:hypothetical protein
MLRPSLLPALALASALACIPALAGQRAFIISTGTDANAAAGCTPVAPCRSLQAAHGAVDAGGEIVALDTAGYAPVVISKSVTILGNPGVVASISVATGIGVAIATPGVNVVLRNVNINGTGGSLGVTLTEGNSLTLENCVIANLGSAGLYVTAAARVRIVNSVMRGNGNSGAFIAGNATADVVSSQFMGNGSYGLYVTTSPGGTTNVSVSDSVASGNDTGFFLWANSGGARMALVRSTAANNSFAGFSSQGDSGQVAVMTVGSSMATGNHIGFSNLGSSTFESLGNNIVRQNTNTIAGTITATPGL